MPNPTPDSYPGTPGTTLYAGLPTPSVGGLITTLSLVNTSGSTQAANFVSPMLGMPFKQGDLPTGEYPAFTLEDDTPVAATVYSDVAWGDDSKKFCGVILRSPASIAGSATQTINVNSGGTAPAASSRSLSDLTAADLKIELTGITALSGVWVASLNTAITDATDIVVIGDGPAGKVWRIGGPFKQSGSAHGQLYCWHYVAALQNNAGGLLGLRYLGRIAQPFADVTSPAIAKRQFSAVFKSGATTLRTLQGTESGEVPDSTISLPHYASIATCGVNAEWDYIQGGGSAAADCTVRVVHDMDYVVKSRMVPPYDRSQSITEDPSVDYLPMCRGRMVRGTFGGGEREDIGVFPSWYVRHIIDPSVNATRQVRVNGMATGGWRTGVRRAATLQPPAVVDVQASYTGMGTIQTGWRLWIDGFGGGMNTINADGGHLWQEEYDGHHRPQGAYYPYLITGEPQYLDMLVEQAASFIMTPPAGADVTWKTSLPITDDTKTGSFHSRDNIIAGTTYKGSGLIMRQDLARYQAWMTRDVGQAVGIYPDTCPYGSAVKTYLSDVLGQNYAAFIAYKNAMPASYREDGLYGLRSVALGRTDHPWCIGYLCNSLAHQYSITGSSAALEMAQHFANYWSAIDAKWDIATAFSIESYMWDQNEVRLNSIDDIVYCTINIGFTYTSGTNVVTKSGGNSDFNFTNGDLTTAQAAFVNTIEPWTRLYVVESTGATCKLSLTPGGAPITFTSTLTNDGGNFGWAFQDLSPEVTVEYTSPEAYIMSISGAIRHLNAIGITSIAAARASADAKVAAAGISLTGNPKNAMAAAYPA